MPTPYAVSIALSLQHVHNHKLSSSQYSWNVLSDAGPPILQLPTTKQIAFNIIVNRCQFLADHSQDDLCLLPAPIQENDGKFVGARSYHDLLHILDNLWPWSWIRVSCRSPCFVELQYVGQNRWKIMFSFSVSHNQIITASCRFFFVVDWYWEYGVQQWAGSLINLYKH